MIDAIVRVSFQSEPTANQSANEALTGDKMAGGSGPFIKRKESTALFHCPAGDDAEVLEALNRLVAALKHYSSVTGFVSITLVRLPDSSSSASEGS